MILRSLQLKNNLKKAYLFLVRCYAILWPAMSVGLSVCLSALTFFGVYGRFLHYCSCQNVLLTFFITAPAHPHATSVAVYTALFFYNLSSITWDMNKITSLIYEQHFNTNYQNWSISKKKIKPRRCVWINCLARHQSLYTKYRKKQCMISHLSWNKHESIDCSDAFHCWQIQEIELRILFHQVD